MPDRSVRGAFRLTPERVLSARRAVRVTVAASVGFYPALYLLDRPVAALYALFTPIALGVLSPLPGAGRDRAGLVLRALPVAVVLTVLGTALAVGTAPAVAGMLAVGFVLTFGTACGLGPAGVAPGLLLFYILACFPPYAPDTLPQRLAGVIAGGLLLALCELLVLPAPRETPYRERVADALALAARAAADCARGRGGDPERAAELREGGRALRMSRLPPGVRPTGAGRTDRALAHTGAAARRLLDQLARATENPAPPPGRDLASVTLLQQIAAECAATSDALCGRRPARGPEALEEMITQFLASRGREADESRERPSPDVLRRQSAVLTMGASAVTARAAVGIAFGGVRAARGLPREQLWYARPGTARLWWIRLTGNITQRSVVFQNAVRTALALAAARLVAGSLDLTHGFWVLLAVLTLVRTTAGATWSAVRAAAVGTLAGALAAGVLLTEAGGATVVYAAVFVPVTLIAFTVGPVAGVAWAQGLFTLVVSSAFAQLAPVTWQVAEARLVDVLTGCGIGLVCAVLAWPAGAGAEVRRGMAALLRSAGRLVPLTVGAALPGGDGPERAPGGVRPGSTGHLPVGGGAQDTGEAARWETLHVLRLAEAAHAQYRSEPGGDRTGTGHDWVAALNFGIHALVGAHWLPRHDPGHAVPPDAARWAREAAGALAEAADRAAGFPPDGIRPDRPRVPGKTLRTAPPGVLPVLVDVENWLATLTDDLAAVGGAAVDDAGGGPVPAPAARGAPGAAPAASGAAPGAR